MGKRFESRVDAVLEENDCTLRIELERAPSFPITKGTRVIFEPPPTVKEIVAELHETYSFTWLIRVAEENGFDSTADLLRQLRDCPLN